ncbi:MAG: Serine/threonine transporter SstT [Firmicutes bacterium]|nr:Serine/threonine transporter SstT [Bacillota bacterium]
MKLIGRLFIAIVGGIMLGLWAPAFLTRILITLQGLVGQLIFFSIPLIIVFFIADGVIGLGSKSAKLAPLTVAFACISTILAGFAAYFVTMGLAPVIAGVAGELAKGVKLTPYFTLAIAPVFGVMSALALSFVLGLGVVVTGSETMARLLAEGKNIIEKLIANIIIPLIPLFIGGIFAGLAAEGTVFNTLRAFGLVLVLAVAMQWVWLLVLYGYAGFVAKKPVFSSIKSMLPAYLTAVGTMSSAATMPVTLQQARLLPIRKEISNFVIPLCATIHLSGSTIAIMMCAMAVMIINPAYTPPTFVGVIPFTFMLGIIMVAAPGVPGGAIMAAYGLLGSMLGFNEAALGLMVALYMAQDSFGTATNVTGDGAIAILVDKYAE